MLTISLLFICACNYDKERSIEDFDLFSESFSRQSNDVYIIEDFTKKWWHVYQNKHLNEIIETGLLNNPQINIQVMRIKQAEQTANISYADFIPTLSTGLGTEKDISNTNETDKYSISANASYELDIWGKNQATYDASKLEMEATIEDFKNTALDVSTSIIEKWITLISAKQELEVLNQSIQTNKSILGLQKDRYANGIATALDVLQQQEILSRFLSQTPDVIALIEITENELLEITGTNPSLSLDISEDKLPDLIQSPSTGIPSDLVAERPDIKAAWLRILSSDQSAKAAHLNRLPSFTLSASYSTTGAAFDTLFNTWLLNLAANLTMPIIDGGRRLSDAKRLESLADERFYNYKAVVLNAIREVEDSLEKNYFQDQKLISQQQQLKASQAALQQAQISYSNGDTSYLNVLNSLVNIQDLEIQIVRTKRDLQLQRITLHKALGLSKWTNKLLDRKL